MKYRAVFANGERAWFPYTTREAVERWITENNVINEAKKPPYRPMVIVAVEELEQLCPCVVRWWPREDLTCKCPALVRVSS